MLCVIISLSLNIIFPWLVSSHTLEGRDVQNDKMTKTSQRTNKQYIYIYLEYHNSLLHVDTLYNTTNVILKWVIWILLIQCDFVRNRIKIKMCRIVLCVI